MLGASFSPLLYFARLKFLANTIIEFTSQVMILILPGWDTSSLRSFIHFIHALRILFACNKVH